MTATFGPALLPDSVKLDLCRELLVEFGATKVRVDHESGEMHHCCVMPWHDDKKPSAALNFKKLAFNCLSCHSHGGLLWFIGVCRQTDSRGVREWVEKQTGTGAEFDLGALLRTLVAWGEDHPREVHPIPALSPRAIEQWMLVHPYLTDPPPCRGIPLESVLSLRLGYAARYPLGEGRTGERVIFPHFWRGNLVGWQSRRIYDDGTPKYLSTEDLPRKRTIYSYDPDRRMAVWVESPMTVARHTHHLPMESTFGSEVSDEHCRLMAAHDLVVLWPDNDKAGWRAVEGWDDKVGRKLQHHPGLVERLLPYTEVRVVESDWAADGADMDDDTAAGLVAASVPPAAWSRPDRLRCWGCRQYHDGKCPQKDGGNVH